MRNQVLLDLIDEHIGFLELYRANMQKNDDDSVTKVNNEGEEEIEIIKNRLKYLQDEENFLPEHIHILFEDIYNERINETLGYAINAFNHDLIKIAKFFAISITISHHMPSVGQIIDIIANNKVCRSIIIDAEYFNADLLTNFMFVNALNSAPNLHFIKFAIGEQGEYDEVDPAEVAEFLSGKLNKDTDLCIAWTCGIFFIKERGEQQVLVTHLDEEAIIAEEEKGGSEEIVEKEEEESQNLSIIHKKSLSRIEDFQNAIENRDSFNIILLYQGIASGFVEYDVELDISYHHNLDISLVKAEQDFDGWRIIDYAARHQYTLLIHEFYRAGKVDLGRNNQNSETTLEIAVTYGTPEVIAALIGLSLPLSLASNICSSHKYIDILNTKLNCGKTLLMLAASKGNQENLDFLLRLGADYHMMFHGKTALNYALEVKHYTCALSLLRSGSKFPEHFDYHVDRSLTLFYSECNSITQSLKEGDLSKVERFIKMDSLTARFLSTDNHSAPYIAFLARQYEIYALLRSRGFELMKDEEISMQFFTTQERSLLQKHMMSFSNKDAYSSINFLMSKSRILQPNDQHLKSVQHIYKTLSDIPEVLHIFRVLEYSGKHFDILFDFDQDNVAEISASTSQNAAGSCVFKVGYIFIAGKVALDQLMGTTAHELTHQAIDILYNNECNPFLDEDAKAIEQLTDIERETQESAKDDIIKRVFKCYKEKDWHAEIIVRVPHILAIYGSNKKSELLLENEAPGLRDFYAEYVVKKCESFVCEIQNRGVKGLSPETELSIYYQRLKTPETFSTATIAYAVKELIENWNSVKYIFKEIIDPLLPVDMAKQFNWLFERMKVVEEVANYDSIWIILHLIVNVIGLKSLPSSLSIAKIAYSSSFNTATYVAKYYAYQQSYQLVPKDLKSIETPTRLYKSMWIKYYNRNSIRCYKRYEYCLDLWRSRDKQGNNRCINRWPFSRDKLL
jgi:ankyrin repeat protein